MNLTENEQMYKTLELLKQKVSFISSITDEEKEILRLMTDLFEKSIGIIDDIQETMEI
ncbi:MAG: hypothetical protein QCI00_04555 [Candidatus Thermoplasmatota archaeon]|nr:hypothetical protein [Candidatus Thermoplasmatota archaeon]